MRVVSRWFADRPLVLKLLLPYLALVLVGGCAGTALVAHDLSARAQVDLDRRLSSQLLGLRGAVHDRELYVLESARFAANEAGMAEAARSGDRRRVAELLRSVQALKRDLDLVAVTTTRGGVLAAAGRLELPSGGRSAEPLGALLRASAADSSGRPRGRVVALAGRPVLLVVAPVCIGTGSCKGAPQAVAAAELVPAVQAATEAGTSVTVLALDGTRLASTPGLPPAPARRVSRPGLLRVERSVGGERVQTLYADVVVQGAPAAQLAVSTGVGAAFAAARGTALRFAWVLAAVLLGVVGIGVLLSRALLRRLLRVLHTTEALGRGRLDARTGVSAADEVGRLAQGVDEMAARLQAAVTTLESQREQGAEEVRRLLQARSQFFAGLSHEVRTPLAIARMQAELLLERPGVRAADRDGLLAVRSAAGQALDLVNEVLEVAKGEAGHVAVEPVALDLHAVVDDLRPVLSGLAGGAEVTSSVQLPADLPPVWADPRRLREVLLNLLDNAVKYTPAGGSVVLRAAPGPGPDTVSLQVTDTGVGVPADALPQLFTAFYQVPGTRTQRGQASTGLGLALTRQLVEALGGSITADSEPGRGTTMTVVLRRASATGAPVPLPAQPVGAGRATSSTAGAR